MRNLLLCLAIMGLGAGCMPPSGGGSGGGGNDRDDDDGRAGNGDAGPADSDGGVGPDFDASILPSLDASIPRDRGFQNPDQGTTPPPRDFSIPDEGTFEEDFGFGPDFGFPEQDQGVGPSPGEDATCLDVCTAYGECMGDFAPGFDAFECASECEADFEDFGEDQQLNTRVRNCIMALECGDTDEYQDGINRCFDAFGGGA